MGWLCGRSSDVTGRKRDLSTQGRETAQVEIHRPVTDGAPSRHGNPGIAAPGQHGSQCADAGPHRADDFIPGVAQLFVRAAERDHAIFNCCLAGLAIDHQRPVNTRAPQLVDQAQHVLDVR